MGTTILFCRQEHERQKYTPNIRQQIKALGHNHQKDMEQIQNILDSWQCQRCNSSTTPTNIPEDGVSLRPIGVVSTWFPEKRGTPRQPGICVNSQGKLTLFNSVFTNPEHALEGLEGFSHMWILYHFHRNDSSHVRAKVSPPRLNGARTGVFGTRSPHRPSPIGLSLVTVKRVEGSSVYFCGVDMVDGTPVLDIKPYIPQYDNPLHCETSNLRYLDGREAEDEPMMTSPGDANLSPVISKAQPARPESRIGEREAPDGEEGARPSLVPLVGIQNERTQVRIPSWITQPPLHKLKVTFSDRAKAQLENIERETENGENPETSIQTILQEDPRSVYLRERWGNQFYTFLICNLHVSCKFDDSAHTVTVFQVKSAGKLCECGQPEWQCSAHGES
ncbi:tRNA (adenine(37)-N6)-methyltransferase-like isoform X2 [Zootermopsis nevadensis]|uniref:tRNA (adenine(37)-N6)-methyltransferase-like isoform X2 n=1 Tax=Zootermopsis nevadensis TaxID=136037 RepID=UPI000B8E5041|nr:tRNA (adenine(37)-N6)-methyltransferase-like isoform X2 [Zootermopsis nevadensis]